MKNRISRAQIEYHRSPNHSIDSSAEHISCQIERVLQQTFNTTSCKEYNFPEHKNNIDDDQYYQLLIDSGLYKEALLFSYYMIGKHLEIIGTNYYVVSPTLVSVWESRVAILDSFIKKINGFIDSDSKDTYALVYNKK